MEKKWVSELLSYQNPKWSPSDKLTFGKLCQISLGPFTRGNHAWIDYPHRARTSYKFNKQNEAYDIYTKIYTDDGDLILGLMDKYIYSEVKTPMSEKHENILMDQKTLIRDKLWFGKYKHRLNCWIPWHQRGTAMFHSKSHKEPILADAQAFFSANFDRDKDYVRNTNYGYGDNLPYIYTNDEHSLMLFKIAFNDRMNIDITTIMTFDEIKELV